MPSDIDSDGTIHAKIDSETSSNLPSSTTKLHSDINNNYLTPEVDPSGDTLTNTLVTIKLMDLKVLKEQRYHLLDQYNKIKQKYKNNKREMSNFNSKLDAILQCFSGNRPP